MSKEMHEFIDGMKLTSPEMPLHKQQLRRAVLKVQPYSSRRRVAAAKIKETIMKQNKKFIGAGSFAALAIIAASMVIYTYQHTPKAVAEQALKHGMFTLAAASPDRIKALEGFFGGSPADALKEAHEAKDLRTITEDEYNTESRNAKGVFASSLGEAGQPSTVSMSIGGGAGTVGAVGGTTGGYSVAYSSASATTDGITTVVPANGPGEAGTVMSSNTVTIDGGTVTSGSVSGPTPTLTPVPGNFQFVGNANADGTINTPPVAEFTQMGTDGKPMKIDPTMLKSVTMPAPIKPTTYLRYTDPKGHVVVLSLDAEGVPIFRTVFMTVDEMPQAPTPAIKTNN